ncbi:putative membrane protein (TIGR02226 family) [Roseimicrobium gellanilyticum]|uniref:Putative membrane protein (TIGR02226 family) n=1 Tax=Roseimicrobium gellanilyticum TaxID=748857 RepID=A0A366HPZ0_9BACT|nr:BatA domain-containing protein [Roseimicrobium gellanilyticum]RBP44591.1 putative membrane protein (TIGR02226 family) [Roseimicrobium gellanilyticum]
MHPGFLWAMAALAVPLWIHLSRRRRYTEVPVGTLRFLNEVLKERRKRSRFEEIPLLLLRLLAVALLALAFCRPFLNSSEKAVESPAETVVLLDASGSVTEDMKDAGMKLLQQSTQQVAEGSKLTLAQFSDEVETINPADKWTPRAGAPTDLTRAMGWALDRLGGSGTKRAGKIVLIAHLAEGDLPPNPPRVWPPGVTLEVHALTPPSSVNAAVRNVTLLTPYVMEQMEIEAEVILPPGADRTVTLKAEGITATEQVLEGADRVIFKINPPRDEVRGTISVAGTDAWPADDARPFAVRWVEPRKVKLIDGNPGTTPFEGQAYFGEKALTASGAAHGKTPFQPDIAYGLSGRQGATDLTGVGAVALCGLPNLSTADARQLAQYVESGGGLVVILDARWTRGASAVLETAGLLPNGVRPAAAATMPASADESGPVRAITQWERTHPVLAAFDGREGGDLREIEWRDCFDIPEGDGWKALAKLDGGHALLLEKTGPVQKGRVLVLAHSLTREWTDLPRDPLFVPFVKSLFSYASRAEGAGPELKPRHPGIHEKRAPGLYDTASGGTEIVAAAPAESSVVATPPEALRRAFGVPDTTIQTITPKDDPTLATASVPWRHELWPWAVALLLVLLTVENIVATRRPTRNA